jgi:hypothetical protein
VEVRTDGPASSVQFLEVDGAAGLITVLNPTSPIWSATVDLSRIHE